MAIIKDLRAQPASAPNDGSGHTRVCCTVFSRADAVTIESVSVDLRTLGGPADAAMRLDPGRSIPETREGVYHVEIEVPLLAETGRHDPLVRALDSEGNSAKGRARLEVEYARIAAQGGPGADLGRWMLERAGKVETVGGNRIEPLLSGDDSMRDRLELIRSAKRQINLQTYIMDDEGQVGEIVKALQERAAAGIEVNVILNATTQIAASPLSALRLKFAGVVRELQSLGRRIEFDISRLGSRETFREYFDEARRGFDRGMQGVNLVMFDPDRLRKAQGPPEERPGWAVWLRAYSERNAAKREGRVPDWLPGFQGPGGLPALPLLDYAIHEKLLIVDGERAIVGGRNLDDRYFHSWIDLDLMIHGPLVKSIQRGFLRSFNEFSADDEQRVQPIELLPDPAPSGSVEAQFVQSRPWAGDLSVLHSVVTLIQLARQRVLIGSQYVALQDCLLRRALFDAVQRGVRVKLISNSLETSSEVTFGSGYFVSLRHFGELIRAGIEVYLVNGTGDSEQPQPYYHAKEIIVDGEVAAVGSFNLTMRSCYIESENMINLFDSTLVRRLEQVFEQRLETQCSRLTPELFSELSEQARERMEIARYAELLY
ncbi:MAG: phosphatidylserine/phosphatidylglycerophosphate/cardiolipin synthase family protein [Candidatus Alcyoniella australis]|nr:phosphatidylserine/phosphatidylglycerophosphate/cardiolipin synthase family protein [Candidatus Alcyoniella australis]